LLPPNKKPQGIMLTAGEFTVKTAFNISDILSGKEASGTG
jgi:hypothetical protein